MNKIRSTLPVINPVKIARTQWIPWRTRVGLGPLLCSILIHTCFFVAAIWCGKIILDSNRGSNANLGEQNQSAKSLISINSTQSPKTSNTDSLRSKIPHAFIPVPHIELPTNRQIEPAWSQKLEQENTQTLNEKSVAANKSATQGSEAAKSNQKVNKSVNNTKFGSRVGNDSKNGYQTATSTPKLISSSPPKYPRVALKKGIQGVAMVKVTVGPAGSVSSCSIWSSTGDQTLDQAALDAVRNWKFTPGHKGGPKVLVKVSFRLS